MNAKNSTARRVSSGVGVVALAAGMTIAGAGLASAAPATGSAVDANRMTVQQSVDSSTVSSGDEVVVESRFSRRSNGAGSYFIVYLHEGVDILDGCFERVDTTVKYDGEVKSDWVINDASWVDQGGQGTGVGWPIATTNFGSFHTVTIANTYRANCDAGSYPLGVGVNDSLKRETFPGTGPTITVTEDGSNPGGGSTDPDVPGDQQPGDGGGSGSLGFLGSLDIFGSLGL